MKKGTNVGVVGIIATGNRANNQLSTPDFASLS